MSEATMTDQDNGFVLKGWHVLAILLAFFATVIAVDVGFSVMAVRTFPGEDVQNSYVQGNHYNETLAERAREAQLGWRATAEIALRDDAPVVVIELRDRQGAPLNDLALGGFLRRPATTSADRKLAFRRDANGTYVAAAPGLGAGAWDLETTATRADQSFEIRARLINPAPTP